jgi:hypothetical protein
MHVRESLVERSTLWRDDATVGSYDYYAYEMDGGGDGGGCCGVRFFVR